MLLAPTPISSQKHYNQKYSMAGINGRAITTRKARALAEASKQLRIIDHKTMGINGKIGYKIAPQGSILPCCAVGVLFQVCVALWFNAHMQCGNSNVYNLDVVCLAGKQLKSLNRQRIGEGRRRNVHVDAAVQVGQRCAVFVRLVPVPIGVQRYVLLAVKALDHQIAHMVVLVAA